MGHTNSTVNYNLPQFVGTDKPSWLGDVNGAFLAIDTAIAAAKTTADSAAGGVAGLQTTVGSHTTQIGTLTDTVTAQGGTLNSVTALIGNGTPTTTDQTIIGAINELNSEKVGTWTLLGSVTGSAVSGGSPVTDTLTVPASAKEFLLQLVGSDGTVFISTNGVSSDTVITANYHRVVTNAITDYVQAGFTPSTGALVVWWATGSDMASAVGKLYYR